MTKIRSTDGSVIDDRRGQGGGGGLGIPGLPGGGGGGLPIPFPTKAGGGLLAIIIALAALFLPKLLNAGHRQAADVPAAQSQGGNPCQSELEQIICGVSVDVQQFWGEALPRFYPNVQYAQTKTVFFEGQTDTGCGAASAETGPFYCPIDQLVYIDLGFMQQLEQMLVGQTSDLAEQYIIAHEYGHHVQNLLGTNAQVQQAQQNDPGRANQYSVALELQADCYAGVWVGSRDVLENEGELDEAIKAAEGVGDDRIQQKTQGRIDPESWTHGSAEQRKTWLLRGYNTKDPTQCDTFKEVLGQ